ncbi:MULTISPECIES: hypothetical protein [Raoultella]|uniref:hypothetical protein n=1 Tax=Raoultella TaxID=160674 RepID=UPI00216749C7|nr:MULTISPECIES: hypothetical protein [Raoultella]MCS4273510.1 hypothetical protein [Raoultella sp. BIGb0132]MCS4290139.1 hypothetical protein [Raoultella terrigena]
MDKYDRKLQYNFLMSLYRTSPQGMSQSDYNDFSVQFGEGKNIEANLLYLQDHELITTNIKELRLGLFEVMPAHLRITSKGIDFVRDDGGLSAILNVQTIKFHRDAVVVLEDLIAISNMNDEQKENAKSTLGEMSTEALKAVVQAVTTAGLSALLGK